MAIRLLSRARLYWVLIPVIIPLHLPLRRVAFHLCPLTRIQLGCRSPLSLHQPIIVTVLMMVPLPHQTHSPRTAVLLAYTYLDR